MSRLADPRLCETCKVQFTPLYKKRRARFCSRRCGLAAAGRGAYTPERAAKIGAAQRGRGAGKAYRKLNGRHEHRVVAEQKLGRPLTRVEVVHHVDGDHLNNDPANLEVITQGEHMRRHGLAVRGVTPPWRPWEKRRKAEVPNGVHV